MANLRDWSDPFLEQAKEDLKAAQATYAAGSPSTFCMLLQMTFEKLGKAAFARMTKNPQITEPPHTHQTATRLLELLVRIPDGLKLRSISVRKNRERIFQAVQEFELSHPDSVKKAMNQGVTRYPQLEYPWQHPGDGSIQWPAQHLPIAKRINDPRGRETLGADLLRFAREVVNEFNALFP